MTIAVLCLFLALTMLVDGYRAHLHATAAATRGALAISAAYFALACAFSALAVARLLLS